MDGDGIRRFVEQDAVVADAETEQARELAFERIHSPLAGFGVAVEGLRNTECGLLFDGADLDRHIRLEADFLHAYINRPCGRESDPW